MWYVVQVLTGKEEEMKKLFMKRIAGYDGEDYEDWEEDETGEGADGAAAEKKVLEDCFVPYYEEMKKYNGKWHKEKSVLFPGYVFVITKQVEKLNDELKKIPAFSKILGDWDCLVPLSDSEVAFLCRFGGKNRIVGMSKGIIENDQVKIIDGALMGMEGCIRKLDRHKRKARIVTHFLGREMEVTVGVEIIAKI